MAHIINEGDRWFLNMHRKDPLLHREFSLGDSVVVCSKCRTVQTYDTWTFNSEKCIVCNSPDSTDHFTKKTVDPNYGKTIRITKPPKKPDPPPSVKRPPVSTPLWYSEQSVRRRQSIIIGLMALLCVLMVCIIAYQQMVKGINFWPSVPLRLLEIHLDRSWEKLVSLFQKIKAIHILQKLKLGNKLHSFLSFTDAVIQKINLIKYKFGLLFRQVSHFFQSVF